MIIQINTETERETLEEFKKKVEDLSQDEVTLTRFLRARDFDLKKAEDMLRTSLRWRKEHKMDSILKEWDPPAYLKTDLPYRILGFDYEGGPVIWIPFGTWNHRPWVEQGYGDELLRWGYRLIEETVQTMKTTPGGRYQCLAIFDLANISYYQATHIASLKVLYNGFCALEQNYPEVLKCVVIINAPWLFSIPFNFLKGTISANTLSKLKVFDSKKSDWLKFLTSKCGKNLPREYLEDENGN